jgi:hypothetical protein
MELLKRKSTKIRKVMLEDHNPNWNANKSGVRSSSLCSIEICASASDQNTRRIGFINSSDGKGRRLLRNVDTYLHDYTTSHPTRHTSDANEGDDRPKCN